MLSVPETMCTVNVESSCFVPAGTVTGPQVRTPCWLIEQPPWPQPEPVSAIVQSRPEFAGSWSVRVTPCASPSPEFQTVIVKPIWSPALTCALSAVFLMWIAAPCTVIGSSAQPDVASPLFESPL